MGACSAAALYRPSVPGLHEARMRRVFDWLCITVCLYSVCVVSLCVYRSVKTWLRSVDCSMHGTASLGILKRCEPVMLSIPPAVPAVVPALAAVIAAAMCERVDVAVAASIQVRTGEAAALAAQRWTPAQWAGASAAARVHRQ